MMPSVSHTLVSPKADTDFTDMSESGSSEREFSTLLDQQGQVGAGGTRHSGHADTGRAAPSSAERHDTSKKSSTEASAESSSEEPPSKETSSGESSSGEAAATRRSATRREAATQASAANEGASASPVTLNLPRLGLLPTTSGLSTGSNSKAALSSGGALERLGREGSIGGSAGQTSGSKAATTKLRLSGESATETVNALATPSAKPAADATLATVTSGATSALTANALSSAASAALGTAGPSMTTSATSQTPLPTFSVPQPVGSSDWSQQLGDRILTVVRADVGEAVINMAPEELGPVKVSLSVTDGEVRLQWIAPVNETRQALEQALPRLREMFAQEGLQLADSQVTSGGSQDNPRDFRGSTATRNVADRLDPLGDSGATDELIVKTERNRTGLLDLYV